VAQAQDFPAFSNSSPQFLTQNACFFPFLPAFFTNRHPVFTEFIFFLPRPGSEVFGLSASPYPAKTCDKQAKAAKTP